VSEALQWARVRSDVNCGVRRGAWYEVVGLSPEQAVLNVGRQPVTVARSVLQIVPVRPPRWSVVPRPRDAINVPLSWGSTYAVCPNCCYRQALQGQATELPCAKCNGVFAVAWDDPY
jgi:hypothetical protein